MLGDYDNAFIWTTCNYIVITHLDIIRLCYSTDFVIKIILPLKQTIYCSASLLYCLFETILIWQRMNQMFWSHITSKKSLQFEHFRRPQILYKTKKFIERDTTLVNVTLTYKIWHHRVCDVINNIIRKFDEEI